MSLQTALVKVTIAPEPLKIPPPYSAELELTEPPLTFSVPA